MLAAASRQSWPQPRKTGRPQVTDPRSKQVEAGRGLAGAQRHLSRAITTAAQGLLCNHVLVMDAAFSADRGQLAPSTWLWCIAVGVSSWMVLLSRCFAILPFPGLLHGRRLRRVRPPPPFLPCQYSKATRAQAHAGHGRDVVAYWVLWLA